MFETFGSLVRNRRIQMGLSQKDFAELCGIDTSSLSLIESDSPRTRNIRPKRIYLLMKEAQILTNTDLYNKVVDCFSYRYTRDEFEQMVSKYASEDFERREFAPKGLRSFFDDRLKTPTVVDHHFDLMLTYLIQLYTNWSNFPESKRMQWLSDIIDFAIKRRNELGISPTPPALSNNPE